MWRRFALIKTNVSEKHHLHYQGEKNQRTRNNISSNYTANVVPSSLILLNLVMEAIRSSETSVLTTPTQGHIPEDGFIQSDHREDLRSYIPADNNATTASTATQVPHRRMATVDASNGFKG
jgi:hypothetical protein